jgi:transposase
MSARTALQIPQQGAAAANRHHPSRQPRLEHLQRENERLQRELEELQRKTIERDQRIAEAERQIAERDQRIAEAEKRVAETERQIAEGLKQVAEAEKKIADLERQLGLRQQNSTNSSKPPSSDGLAGAPRPRGRRKKSRRKVGGQPGHRGAHRPPVPAERVKEVRPVLPEQCQHCGHSLPLPVVTTDTPQRHQVIELPPLQPHVIEYQCHEVACPACGKSTRAAIPAEARGDFGPRLAALITYLTVVCRMPRRVVRELLAQALGIEISLGSVQKCWEEASQAVAAPCQELEDQLKDEPVLNVDETGWRTNGGKRYLWAFVAARYVVYTIAATRGSEVLVRLLGAVFRGILCSDRFSAYLKYHSGQAQFCWAHLKRNLLGILDLSKTSEVERFCRDALAQHARLFRLWHKFRGGQIDRSQLLLRALPIREKISALAERHRESCHREVRNLAQALFQYNGRLFTFLEHERVEPTNNSVERALRTGVQWRKICFGSRSATGELATARLLTVAETCELQRLNLLAYLAAALACHRRRQQVASLLSR